jgi:uncharacterized membrane protein (Fun14 family)
MCFCFSGIIKPVKKIKKYGIRDDIRLIAALVGIFLLIGVLYLFVHNVFFANDGQFKRLTDDATSTKNIDLMRKAVASRDESICDQIKGAINYTDPNQDLQEEGVSMGVSIVTPAMTESEAKAECHKHVQQLIDQNKYEVKVCADKSITHYMFNNARFPCPEE